MNSILQTLKEATLSFFFSSKAKTTSAPHIRDSIDLKRIMILVVLALIPCTIVAIFNSGMQSYAYGSYDPRILGGYFAASHSFAGYFNFLFEHFWAILFEGLYLFLPTLIISYIVGGFWEILFAAIRKTEVSEGYLVTGILFALTLPPTLPYWMIVVGVSLGIVIGKELFGGTGMNILNPALTCRCILYFAFPSYMTGDIWVGANPFKMQESVMEINTKSTRKPYDGYTTATPLSFLATPETLKRIHVDAIALQFIKNVPLRPILETKLKSYNPSLNISNLSPEQLTSFITSPKGLALPPDQLALSYRLANLKYNRVPYNNCNLFFGNQTGSFGETSIFACILGALFLLLVGIASYHTMLSVIVGAYVTALLFQFGSLIGADMGAFNPAHFDLPAYKHLLIGGLAFGLVFMATDPVSSPSRDGAKWLYGTLIGALVIVIRLVNPAFPEGVMLAILFGNVFAPLFDKLALKFRRRGIYGKVTQ